MHKLIPIYIILVILFLVLTGCSSLPLCKDCAVLSGTAPSVQTEFVTVNGKTYTVETLKVK